MKIKTTTAFRAYTHARQERAKDAKNFMVRRLNKDGSISKAPLTQSDWQMNAFSNEEDAKSRVTQLESWNPGCRYVIVPV